MADAQSFFAELEHHYQHNLPFVVYSRPINSIIKCWLQNNDSLHKTKSFIESGFVFAPFDLNNQAIIFPESECDHRIIELEQLKTIPWQGLELETSETEKEIHKNLVSKGIAEINSGRLSKVVLSRKKIKEVAAFNPLELFKRLFNTYKNAMVYCWYHPKVGLWMGATPELLFKVEGSKLTAISLAGTLPYEEAKFPEWTQKELEEQDIVTRFLANQIEPFSLKTDISKVESVRAGRLWHLKSRLTSRLRPETRLLSLIEALHPTPAVCGLPKRSAKSFILTNENYDREFYTGFLGELNLQKVISRKSKRINVENNAYKTIKSYSNFYVNLRCMQIIKNEVHLYVGGGVTYDSNAENEFEETQNKARTISTILG